MAYASGGKYWNVGLSEPGRLAATQKQLWSLHLLSGRKEDFRGRGLTRDDASSLIRKMNEERKEARQDIEGSAMRDALFEAMMKKAVREANAAGDAWLEANPNPVISVFDPETNEQIGVHGAIGYAYITWPPKRSQFARWLRRNHSDGSTTAVWIPHAHVGRLERDLLLVCEAAALRYLETQGVTGMELVLREDASTRKAA